RSDIAGLAGVDRAGIAAAPAEPANADPDVARHGRTHGHRKIAGDVEAAVAAPAADRLDGRAAASLRSQQSAGLVGRAGKDGAGHGGGDIAGVSAAAAKAADAHAQVPGRALAGDGETAGD